MDSAHNTVQTETFNISAGSRNFLEANFSLRADWAMKEQRMCQEHCNVKMRWRGLEGGPRLGRWARLRDASPGPCSVSPSCLPQNEQNLCLPRSLQAELESAPVFKIPQWQIIASWWIIAAICCSWSCSGFIYTSELLQDIKGPWLAAQCPKCPSPSHSSAHAGPQSVLRKWGNQGWLIGWYLPPGEN